MTILLLLARSRIALGVLLVMALTAGLWGWGEWRERRGAAAEREQTDERTKQLGRDVGDAVRNSRGLDDAALRERLRELGGE